MHAWGGVGLLSWDSLGRGWKLQEGVAGEAQDMKVSLSVAFLLLLATNAQRTGEYGDIKSLQAQLVDHATCMECYAIMLLF